MGELDDEADARNSWPSRELLDSFLGTGFDFELRLGEHTPIPEDDPEAAADARRFREVLGLFATGVTVVTTMSDGSPVGITCQSFSSVSLDPPLVMFCPAKTSRAWPLIRAAGFFCVNLLHAGQEDLSNRMATKRDEKFDGIRWKPATSGAPLLEGVIGYVDCTVHRVWEAGDHYVVIGKVEDLDLGDTAGHHDTDPLLFFRGQYARLADEA